MMSSPFLLSCFDRIGAPVMLPRRRCRQVGYGPTHSGLFVVQKIILGRKLEFKEKIFGVFIWLFPACSEEYYGRGGGGNCFINDVCGWKASTLSQQLSVLVFRLR